MSTCLNCGESEAAHAGSWFRVDPESDCPGFRDEPTDNEIYNRPGVEGGIGYPIGPEAMSEHDWRL